MTGALPGCRRPCRSVRRRAAPPPAPRPRSRQYGPPGRSRALHPRRTGSHRGLHPAGRPPGTRRCTGRRRCHRRPVHGRCPRRCPAGRSARRTRPGLSGSPAPGAGLRAPAGRRGRGSGRRRGSSWFRRRRSASDPDPRSRCSTRSNRPYPRRTTGLRPRAGAAARPSRRSRNGRERPGAGSVPRRMCHRARPGSPRGTVGPPAPRPTRSRAGACAWFDSDRRARWPCTAGSCRPA